MVEKYMNDDTCKYHNHMQRRRVGHSCRCKRGNELFGSWAYQHRRGAAGSLGWFLWAQIQWLLGLLGGNRVPRCCAPRHTLNTVQTPASSTHGRPVVFGDRPMSCLKDKPNASSKAKLNEAELRLAESNPRRTENPLARHWVRPPPSP